MIYVSAHYNDVIMSAMASKITSLTIVFSTVYSGADQRRHQSSALLAFFLRGMHRWPVNSTHKCPETRDMFPFDNVIIIRKRVHISSHCQVPVCFYFQLDAISLSVTTKREPQVCFHFLLLLLGVSGFQFGVPIYPCHARLKNIHVYDFIILSNCIPTHTYRGFLVADSSADVADFDIQISSVYFH